ncbi:metallophosphoesterase [Spirulina sp. CS-785/01]|uniref:metallophosphoesterase family protein n=1 Tax=Spirulina sp. CS-785/01 TaxID=3021716 RepID=UPI00232B62CA|nr:metallophosphoesterase [Spirulina sp. CS-785/01]MDB9315798.1 metallophosphoesterase [Spirulina sp. CS-785/01]
MSRKIKRRQLLIQGILGTFSLIGLDKIFSHFASSSNPTLASPLNKNPDSSPSPPQDSDNLLLRFVSVADTGTGASGQYEVANAMTHHYRQNPYPLVILAGDNIYNEGEIEKVDEVFEEPYAPLLQHGVQFHACLGNHDIRTDNGTPQVHYPGFHMQGRRYYTFQQGPVQFFALDTNHNADWAQQLPWLKQALANSNALWKIVFGHHQIYASGVYGPNNAAWVQPVKDLMKQYGVKLYINGHEHHYERTEPINGITYLTCGGGAGTRPVGRSPWTEFVAQRLSFAAYEVYANRIEIQGIGTNHQVFDRGMVSN